MQLELPLNAPQERERSRRRYPQGAVCEVDDCGAPIKARGLCFKHYLRLRRHGDPTYVAPSKWEGVTCSVDGCEMPAKMRGWCPEHYHRWHRKGDPVAVDGRTLRKPRFDRCTANDCDRMPVSFGLCPKHLYRLRTYGDANAIPHNRRFTGQACAAPDCDRMQVSLGYCDRHYRSLVVRDRDPDAAKARGRASSRRRRARKVSATVDFYTEAQVMQRMAYWGNRCWMCGGDFEHVDHVKPLAAGGKDCLSNFRPACRLCNASKGGRWYGVANLHRFMRTADAA